MEANSILILISLCSYLNQIVKFILSPTYTVSCVAIVFVKILNNLKSISHSVMAPMHGF